MLQAIGIGHIAMMRRTSGSRSLTSSKMCESLKKATNSMLQNGSWLSMTSFWMLGSGEVNLLAVAICWFQHIRHTMIGNNMQPSLWFQMRKNLIGDHYRRVKHLTDYCDNCGNTEDDCSCGQYSSEDAEGDWGIVWSLSMCQMPDPMGLWNV